METTAFVREQLQQMRSFLEGTLADLGDEALHSAPPGVCNSIAATYAHVLTGEDGFVNGLLRGKEPLFVGQYAGRTGLSKLPPQGAGWAEWGATVRVDRPAVYEYARAVAAATDDWIASLAPADLDHQVDLTSMGLGNVTLGWVLGAGVLGHVTSHWGEICALKGLSGGRGFPF